MSANEPVNKLRVSARPVARIDEQLDRGMALQKAGRLAEAQRLYAEVVRREPKNANGQHLLGLVLHQQGQHAAAISHLQQAARLEPKAEVVWTNLSAVHQALGQHREAALAAREALKLNANNAQAHFNLGCALQSQEKFADAAACFQHALQRKSDWPDAFQHLGHSLLQLGQGAAAQFALGNAALGQGRIDEAADHFRRVVDEDPNNADAHNNLGVALSLQGKLDEATQAYQQALKLKPDYAEPRGHLGLMLLQRGDFEAGWSNYEWRWRTNNPLFRARGLTKPRWDGHPIPGKTLLLHAEQGMGDAIQFVRYAPLLREHGQCRILLECHKRLKALLAGCPGVDEIVVRGETLPEHDYHLPLLSAPYLLNTRLDNIPAQVPYLHARADLVDLWRERLRDCAGLKVGICWQGNPKFPSDRQRSFPLRHFAPLAQLPGVHLVSLQKGPGSEQVATASFPVRLLGSEVDTAQGPFMDTAAVMRNLDLVITTDTALAHLAGALNVPVWVALSHVPDWRWLLERDDSPWYPSMRLFRQPQPGDWNAVFQKIREALQQQLNGPTSGRASPLTIEVAPGELIDKITILEIKCERIADAGKLANIRTELAHLAAARDQHLPPSADLQGLTLELKQVNAALWQIEDDIRDCERGHEFGPRFVELARAVYHQNDQRAALKRRINELLGSRIVEEKSYQPYAADQHPA